jgi:tRNA 2-thiouridine synthesizing protein E
MDDGTGVGLDEKGYLLDATQWTQEVALKMAKDDGIELNPEHWLVLEIFRDYFSRFEIEPPMRVLVRTATEKLGKEQGGSRNLYRLFPAGPIIQASRYAGLPRPLSCI